MKQYIKFKYCYSGVNGNIYRKGVKYMIKSSDAEYLYVMNDKIKKNDLMQMDEKNYEIGDVWSGKKE